MIVEEYETQVLRLQEYVSGGLVNYQLDIEYHNETESEQERKEIVEIARKVINVTTGLSQQVSQPISDADLGSVWNPFPRSTLLLETLNRELYLYFVDRSFSFNAFTMNSYLDSNIGASKGYPLNRTLLNGQCSNLKHVVMNNDNKYLIMFCLSTDKDTKQSKMTVIQIRDYETPYIIVPKFLYYTQNYEVTKIDFQYPVRFVSNFSNPMKSEDLNLALFVVRKIDNDPELKNVPQLLLMNFTVFDDMSNNNISQIYVPEGGLILRTPAINLTDNYNNKNVIDYKSILIPNATLDAIVDSPNLHLALVIEGEGMLLCNITNYRLLIRNGINFTCIENDNALFHVADGALAVHNEPSNPEIKIYLISTQPALVTEYDVENFRNSRVAKVYKAQEDANKRYIATSDITVNENYVVLCLKDIYTGGNVLRVFTRKTTFFRVVQQDILLPTLARTAFIEFPSFYFNMLIYRDERTVNITRISQRKLVVNRTQSAMQEIPDQSRLNGKTIQVKLSHKSMQDRTLQDLVQFNITFIDKYNTEIYRSSKIKDGNVPVFYSCGDSNFQFDLNYLYSGPEYIMSLDSTRQNGSNESYFTFQNAREVQKFRSPLNSKVCQESMIIPVSSQKNISKMLLVCIDLQIAGFTSYLVNIDTSTNSPIDIEQELILDNQIIIPDASILKYVYDGKMQVIIAIVRVQDNRVKDYVNQPIQVHYIHIEKTMSWKNMHPLDLTGQNAFEEDDFPFSFVNLLAYSEEIQLGVIVDNDQKGTDRKGSAIFLIFKVDFDTFTFKSLKAYPFVNIEGFIKKADITNNKILLILTSTNILKVMYIFEDIIREVSADNRTQSIEILDYDTFEMQYLVIYSIDNSIDVYEIDYGVEYTHRMRLPKYKKFEKYKFKTYPGEPKPKREYFEKTLAIMMTNPETDETLYMVYKLNEPQHNSLYISNNSISQQLKHSNYSWIYLTGDSEDVNTHYLSIVSDQEIQIIQMKYFDTIAVDISKNQKLLEQCKDLVRDRYVELDDYVNAPIQIMKLHPIYDHLDEDQVAIRDYNQQGNITLTIVSANLGLALRPKGDIIKVSQEQCRANQANIQLSTNNLLEGYNMKFKVQCTFGENNSCKEGAIGSIITPSFIFPINYVTASNQVIKSFPIGRFFWMLDSQGRIRIEKVQNDYDSNLVEIYKEPMLKVADWDQYRRMGCRLYSDKDFAQMIEINQTSHADNHYQDRRLFLFFYQCLDPHSNDDRVLQALEIVVYDTTNPDCAKTEESCLFATQITNSTKIVYDIIDIGLANLTYFYPNIDSKKFPTRMTSALSYKFDLVVACQIDTTFSNLILYFNDAYINGTMMNDKMLPDPTLKAFTNLTQKTWGSAAKNIWDTFIVNGISVVPESKFILISLDGFGALFYHNGLNEIIYKFNLTSVISHKSILDEQRYSEGLRVWDAVVHYPFHIYIFSNRGLIVYGFQIEMNDETTILLDPKKYEPQIVRIQKIPYPVTRSEVVYGPYGYIVLFKSPVGRGKEMTKLQAVTFYQGAQSKLFRSVDLGEDQDCHSFNRVPNMEISQQDQIAVSLICNQRLRVVRFCLRPYYDLNLSQFLDDNNGPGGILGYNAFKLNITAHNEYSTFDSNQPYAEVDLRYIKLPDERTNSLTILIFFLTFMVSMFLFLFLRTRSMKQDLRDDLRKEKLAYEIKEAEQRKSMLVYRKTSELFKNSSSFMSRAKRMRELYNNEGNETDDQGGTSGPTYTSNLNQTIYTDTAPNDDRDEDGKKLLPQSDDIRKKLSGDSKRSQNSQKYLLRQSDAKSVFTFGDRDSRSHQSSKNLTPAFRKFGSDATENNNVNISNATMRFGTVTRLSNNIQDDIEEQNSQTIEDESFDSIHFALRKQ